MENAVDRAVVPHVPQLVRVSILDDTHPIDREVVALAIGAGPMNKKRLAIKANKRQKGKLS